MGLTPRGLDGFVMSKAKTRTAEGRRLQAADKGESDWRLWGTYLPARQWGTVREDYSDGGQFWTYLGYDDSRSRAYRWGEDGLLVLRPT